MRFLFFALRAMLMLGALTAATTAAMWRWAPDRVDALGGAIVHDYESKPRELLQGKLSSFEGDGDARVALLRGHLDSLSSYRRGDRRFANRLAAYHALTTALLKMGRSAEAVALANELAALDPFNIHERRWAANRVIEAGGQHVQEGVALWTELFEQFPGDVTITKRLMDIETERRRFLRVVDIALAHLEAIARRSNSYTRAFDPWTLTTADSKAGLAQAEKVSVAPGKGEAHLVLNFLVPPSARFVRLLAPPHARATLGHPLTRLAANRTGSSVDLVEDLGASAQDAFVSKLGLELTGQAAPEIALELPLENADVERRLTIGFPCDRSPRWLEKPLVLPVASPRIKSLRARASSSLREELVAARVLHSRAFAIAREGVSWVTPDGDSLPLTIDVALPPRPDLERLGPGSFEPDVTWEGLLKSADASTAGIRVPAIEGLIVTLDEFEWSGAAPTAAPEILVDPAQLAALDGRERAWQVLPGATDPTLNWAQTAAPRTNASLRVRGGLR